MIHKDIEERGLDPKSVINEEKFKDRTWWRGFVHSFSEHLHRFGLKSFLICSLNSPMNSVHLNSCPALEASNDSVGKYC
jgi:hypothetical protein